MNKENCALNLVDEIILYYDARSKKNKKNKIFSPSNKIHRGVGRAKDLSAPLC